MQKIDLNISFTEVVGYLASFGILVSFLMKDIKKLRIVNTLGCCLFIWYVVMTSFSMPIIFTNAVIVIINLYYLIITPKK